MRERGTAKKARVAGKDNKRTQDVEDSSQEQP